MNSPQEVSCCRLKRIAHFGFLLLAGWIGSATCTAALDALTITTNHYLVTGSTLREIRQSINQMRPGGAKARTDALTTWNIKWQTQVSPVGGEYRLTSFSTTTTIIITMPSWKAPTNAAPQVMKKWLSYYSALQKHEVNHSKTGTQAAEALRKRIGEVGSDPDRTRLQQRIQQLADAVIAEFRKRDADYDRETDHGRKDGANL